MCAHCRLARFNYRESEMSVRAHAHTPDRAPVVANPLMANRVHRNSYCIRDVEAEIQWAKCYSGARVGAAAYDHTPESICFYFVRMYNWDKCENFNLKLGAMAKNRLVARKRSWQPHTFISIYVSTLSINCMGRMPAIPFGPARSRSIDKLRLFHTEII